GETVSSVQFNHKSAECLGHVSKVRVLQLGSRDSTGVVTFLVGTNGAVFLVVHNDNERSGTVLCGGGDFLAVHEELTVTGDRNHTFFREVQRRSHGRGDRIAHGTVAC